MTRSEEIMITVHNEMKEQGIEDTDENRLIFLHGLDEAWKEEPSESFEKTLYQLALSGEIFKLEITLMLADL